MKGDQAAPWGDHWWRYDFEEGSTLRARDEAHWLFLVSTIAYRATNREGKRGENNKSRAPALAYLRTSSAANVGTDKDSEKRQRHAIQGFAKRAGFGIIAEFYDAAVSGADPIETQASRPF